MTTKVHVIQKQELVEESGIQILTSNPGSPVNNQVWINKTSHDFMYYNGVSSVSISDPKKDTYANLVTFALTASDGQLCFSTDEKKMYKVVSGILYFIESAEIIRVVAGETLSVNDQVYISSGTLNDVSRTAGRAYKVDAKNDDRIEAVGFVLRGGNINDTIEIQTSGRMAGFSGLSVGKAYFSSPDFVGQISLNPPSVNTQWAITACVALSATEILINPIASASASYISDADTQFIIPNNIASATDITGLIIDPLKYKAALIDYTIYRKTDIGLSAVAQIGQLKLVYKNQSSLWLMQDVPSGDVSGVVFTIEPSGQIRYTSSNIAGTGYVGILEYNISKVFEV